MHTNLYLTMYPLMSRRHMDEVFDHLVQLSDRDPLSAAQHYSLVALGKPSELLAYDLERKTTDFVTKDSNPLWPLISYRDEFHGAMTPDGRQIYVFGIQPYQDEQLRERMFSELISVRDSDFIPSVVPRLTALHLGLTFWGLYYPESQTAKEAKTAAEDYLRQRGLQVVSRMQDIDAERILTSPEKE